MNVLQSLIIINSYYYTLLIIILTSINLIIIYILLNKYNYIYINKNNKSFLLYNVISINLLTISLLIKPNTLSLTSTLLFFNICISILNYLYSKEKRRKKLLALIKNNHLFNKEGIEEDIELLKKFIHYLEKSKIYTDPDLKISCIASLIGSNRSYLSNALNRRLSKNFNEFINYYRVKEVCKTYIYNNKIDIRDICNISGFKTITSANTAFKYHTGYTLGEWAKEINEKIQKHEEIKLENYIV